MRWHTYPPKFRYIELKRVRSAMGQISRSVIALDKLMRARAPEGKSSSTGTTQPSDTLHTAEVGDDVQQQVIQELQNMERSVDQISSQGLSTNHPRFDAQLAGFKRHVVEARRAAGARPPNYFLAGGVVGRCLHCHEP